MTLPLFSGPIFETSKLTQRPYQQRGIVNVRAQIILGKRRILCVAPTAAGKTVILAGMVRTASLPCLFIAHRLEILDQIVEQLARVGISNVGVIRGADDRFNPSASMQVASIATLSKRDLPFLSAPCQCRHPAHDGKCSECECETCRTVLIFIDEAHRSASQSYVDIIRRYPHAIVIGFTATPGRLDGRPLGGELFEHIEIITTYQELLKRPDWLIAPDCYSSPEKLDLSAVHTAGSDFDETELAQVMHEDKLEGDLVEHWIKLAHRHPVFVDGVRHPQRFTEGKRRSTFVFAVNVAHSESIAARFEQCGVRVAHLDGKTPEKQRRAMLVDLAAGKLEVVCNCNVAIEGIDLPEAKCVVHGRPTWSITLWRQACGRIMRPYQGIIPLLLDHADNWNRLGCPWEDLRWSLNEKPKRIAGTPPMKLCKACFAYVLAGKIVCPYCGFEFPQNQDPEAIPAETNAELVARNGEPDTLKRAFFDRQVTLAKTKGFKPGYASALYKDRYGVWPPREWSDAVKKMLEADPIWKALLTRKLERKAAMDARKEEDGKRQLSPDEFAAKLNGEPVPPPPVEELTQAMETTVQAFDSEEAPFADWLEEQGIE
jgi:DNA repair protein RadD